LYYIAFLLNNRVMVNEHTFMSKSFLFFILIFFAIIVDMSAQGFGRNKPKYRNFNFKVKETPNFDLYYYMDNGYKINEEGQFAELWYRLHQAIFRDTFLEKNPILLYNNHADFQQTNAIGGSIGIGTGGVTEAFKNRVVIPVSFTNQQDFHVLGHELVHAFQYNAIINGDSTSLRSLQNIPLWMVEGMAEYLSKGRNDAYTSMWMRDAVFNDDIPNIRHLNDPKYFPYRYGQAFWSFIAGTYGDEAIKPLFVNTALYGLQIAIDSTLHTGYKELSEKWVSSLKNYYSNFIKYSKEKTVGRKVVSSKNAGKMNVSPSISPNGKYMIFISEKDVFTTDWYLAKTNTGKIIRKLSSKVKDAHIDNYNFLESSGTWSPNSKKFAFVAFKKGKNILVLKEPKSGKTLDEIKINNLRAFTNPVWSPDGKYIVLTGLVEGQVDLYAYYFKSKRLKRLTNDRYSEIHADFSLDGRKLVFATDAISIKEGRTHGKWVMNIAVLDVKSGSKSNLPIFKGADNLNPVFDKDDNIYFLSNRDGFRNMYMYEKESGKVYQKTDFVVGISGITEYSPAISIAKKKGRILYTLYNNRTYSIYQSKFDKFLNKEVAIDDVDMRAGTLPKPNKLATDVVNANLDKIGHLGLVSVAKFEDRRYRPRFKLDYIGGGTSVGVGSSSFSTYTGLAGGIDLLFSDMLGNHQLYSRLSMNGEIYDFGGQLMYINRQNRINWGVGLSHVPYSTGYRKGESGYALPIQGDTIIVDRITTNILRVFDESLNGFWQYPFSTTLRIEGGVTGGYRSFRQDKIYDYYQAYPYGYIGRGERERVDVPDTLPFSQYFRLIKGFSSSVNLAVVGDNSYNGVTSPLAGYKYRVSIEKHFGTDDYQSILGDFRYYYWIKPVSLAIRGMSYLRFENNVNSVYPFYIGQMGMVRGYSFGFGSNPVLDNLSYLDHMLGSKIIMGNFEVRLPFTGVERLALIKSKYFLSDLAVFADIGVAFDEFSHFKDGEPVSVNGQLKYIKPKIAKSVGVSLRVNLFGAMVVEPYLAYPLEDKSKLIFGLNFMPGF